MRERERTKWEYFLCIFLALLIAIVPFWNIKAISSEQFKILVGKKIPYYDVNTCNSNLSIGDNKDYAGNQILTDAQMEAVKANQPFYEKAAEKYGNGKVKWQALAALHYREHGLARDNPVGSSGSGAYQFTSDSWKNGYLSWSSQNGHSGNLSGGKTSDEEFQWQTNYVAYRMGRDMKDNSDNSVKDYFFTFNGRAEKYKEQARKLGFDEAGAERGEGSPYVMNRADAQRDPTAGAGSPNWGQYLIDGNLITYPANNQYGAFVVYAGLGGSSGDSESSSSSSSTREKATGSNTTIIGDSITEMSKSEFESQLSGVDIHSQSSKKFAVDVASNKSGLTILKELVDQDQLRDNLVFALGTNDRAGVTKDLAEEVISLAGDDTNIIFVTQYEKNKDTTYESNNKVLQDVASSHDNVSIADWASAAKADPEKYISNSTDGSLPVHPTNPEGVKLFVDTIIKALNSSTSGGSYCSDDGSGSGNVLESAKELAWPDSGHGPNNSEAKPEQKAAFLKAYKNGQAQLGNNIVLSDCCRFVTTVLHHAGIIKQQADHTHLADDSYNGGDNIPILSGSGMVEIANTGDTSILQPGDILNNNQHCWIYGGENITIDASYTEHVAETKNSFSLWGNPRIYRHTGGTN